MTLLTSEIARLARQYDIEAMEERHPDNLESIAYMGGTGFLVTHRYLDAAVRRMVAWCRIHPEPA